MEAIIWLVLAILGLFWWAVLLAVVANLLISFGVLDTRNRLVWTAADFLERVTEPALRPIRRLLPNFGNIDLSPLVLLLLVQAAGMFVAGTVSRQLLGTNMPW